MRIQKIISGRWSVLVTTLLSLAICAPAALAHTLSFTETDYAAGQTSLGQSLAVGDFNHNGISDIAMIDVPTCYPLPPAQECTGTVSVRLGRKGNRTFTPGIEVALGNGDGTFQAPQVGAIGVSGVLAVGEFDHDGVPDLVATGGGAGTAHVNVLLGNGDGTFQSPQAFDVGGPPTWVVAADLKNRGRRGPDDVVVAIPSGVAVVVNKHHGDIDKPRYTFESFDALSGARETIAFSINREGEIAGSLTFVSPTGEGPRRFGFEHSQGVFTLLTNSGSVTEAWGINAQGVVVGNFVEHTGAGGLTRGFVWTGGVFSPFDIPDGKIIQAFGINDHGQIVGHYADTLLHRARGFIKDGDSVITFDAVLGASETHPFGINNRGQIVGTLTFGEPVTGRPHGFLMDRDSVTIVDIPGSIRTVPYGINNHGQIVGVAYYPTGTVQSFVMSGSQIWTIAVPGALSTEARGINDRGQVVGDWGDGRTIHGFKATPNHNESDADEE